MVTMNDVAKHANVSRATVSRVLSNHPSIAPETREVVMYWVKKLDYKPNKIAQSLAGSKTHLIGVIVPNLSNPFFAQIVDAIEYQAMMLGYSIIVSSHNKDFRKELNILNTFNSRRVDGIITVPSREMKLDSKKLKELKVPVVSVTKSVKEVDSILVNYSKGIEQIVEHLTHLGHERIGFIGPKNSEKYKALEERMKLMGMEIGDFIESNNDGLLAEETYTNLNEYINKFKINSTAIFAHNDIAASEAIRVFKEKGYNVPEDVSIVGFDNTILSMKLSPKITSIAQPTKEIGKYAVDILVEKINGLSEDIKYIELDPRLVVRESTLTSSK